MDEAWAFGGLSFRELAARSPGAAEHGDGEIRALRLDVGLDVALSTRTELQLAAPLSRLDIRWDVDDAHHRSEIVQGVGDIRIGIKRHLAGSARGRHAVFGGISVPVASRSRLDRTSFVEHDEADELGIVVAKHRHQQLGTGTWDPYVGWEGLLHGKGAWAGFGGIEAVLPLSETRDGLRTGASLTLFGGPLRSFPARRLALTLPLRIAWSARDHLDAADVPTPSGIVLDGSIPVPNSGRLQVAFAPMLSWSASEHWSLRGGVEVPLHTRIPRAADGDQVQFIEPFALTLGMSWQP